MQCSIESIIIWPKDTKLKYEKLDFLENKINIITGASRTGKSAIIPIVDYCLGSDKCSIPVDVIRNASSWFGVLFKLDNEKMLLCRQEPGQLQQSGKMFFIRDKEITIPNSIAGSGNDTVDSVKAKLNELFSITSIELDAEHNIARPSYRDFMAFLFQPQNIVANADVLFYKADTIEHKSKLIQIFPYALGAITAEVLDKKQRLDNLMKKFERMNREFNEIKKLSSRWSLEVSSWLAKAVEYGLLTENEVLSKNTYKEKIDLLRMLQNKTSSDASLSVKGLSFSNDSINALKQEEEEISSNLYRQNFRLTEMNKLMHSVEKYKTSLTIQAERLEISKWIEQMLDEDYICPFCNTQKSEKVNVTKFISELKDIETTAKDYAEIPAAFEKEYKIVKEEVQLLINRLNVVQKRIQIQSRENSNKMGINYTIDGIARFLGEMQYATQTFEAVGEDGELKNELANLQEDIDKLRKELNWNEIDKFIKNALTQIERVAQEFLQTLDVEKPNDPISFIIKELTIKIKNEQGRDDYLWEIGSGSNWLSYHIAIICAFQWYFQNKKYVKIPNFIFIDQPSQVYFPQKPKAQLLDKNNIQWTDEDKIAVQKIFTTLANFIKKTSNVQVIVLEHADEDIWGENEYKHLVRRWRDGKKLIPQEWIK